MTNENKTVAQLMEGVEADAYTSSWSQFPCYKHSTIERVFGPVLADYADCLQLLEDTQDVVKGLNEHISAQAALLVQQERELKSHSETESSTIAILREQNASLSRAVAELTESKDAAYLAGVRVGEARRTAKLAEGVLALSHTMDCECEGRSGKNPLQALADESQQPSVNQELLTALKELCRQYIALMENGRNRILDLGGDCDPVDVMERGDPYLRQAICNQAGRSSQEGAAMSMREKIIEILQHRFIGINKSESIADAISAALRGQEPIYQVRGITGLSWVDVHKDFYDKAEPDIRRVTYAHPIPPVEQSNAGKEHHAALQRIGTALGLPAGGDLHTACVPAIAAKDARIAELSASTPPKEPSRDRAATEPAATEPSTTIRNSRTHVDTTSAELEMWRPIETAPKDFTEIDIWNGERIPNCSWGQTTYGRQVGFVYQSDYDSNGPVIELVRDPTHWMPLPAPPSTKLATD